MKDLVKSGILKWIIGLLVLVVVVGGSNLVYRQWIAGQHQELRRRVKTAVVEQSNLEVKIAANGTVQPERAINLSPKTSGVLKQLLVQEGDRVTQGQILAYMDDSNLKGQFTQSQGQLAAAQANLRKLLAGNRVQEIAQAKAQLAEAQANLQKLITGNRPQEIAQAQSRLNNTQATLRQAEDDLQRNQALAAAGAISSQTLYRARTTMDAAQAQMLEAQQALALLQAGTRSEEIDQARAQVMRQQQALALLQVGTRSEEIDQARAQVMQAQGTVQTIQAQLNDTIIRAPFSGTVTRKFADPGAFVTPTTAGSSVSSATSSSILALAAKNQIVAKVAETSIAQINIGQAVNIEADAYPSKMLSGRVTQIAAQSTVEQNVTNFEVKIALADPQNLLRAGMNVNVEFQVGQLQNVLVIPTVAIVRQQSGTGVLVADREPGRRRSTFRPITTGVTVDDKTVIRAGLKVGERVLLSFPPGERPETRTPSLLPGLGPGRGR